MTLAAPPIHLLTGNDLRLTSGLDATPYGARMSDADVRPVSPPTTYDLANESTAMAAALRWARGMIDPFRDLAANWDSYGASPIDDEAADFGVRLLAALVVDHVPPPQVFPTADGGLSMEWHRPNMDFVISIAPPDEPFSAFFRSGTDQLEIDSFGDPRFWEAVSALTVG